MISPIPVSSKELYLGTNFSFATHRYIVCLWSFGCVASSKEYHWQTGRDTVLACYLYFLGCLLQFASKCARKMQSRRCLNDHLITREMSQSFISFYDSGKWKSTVLHDFKFTKLASVGMWPHNTGKRKLENHFLPLSKPICRGDRGKRSCEKRSFSFLLFTLLGVILLF